VGGGVFLGWGAGGRPPPPQPQTPQSPIPNPQFKLFNKNIS